MKRIHICMGSRPDIIKTYPVLKYLKTCPDIDVRVILSGQHTDMADDALDTFQIIPSTRFFLEPYVRSDLSYMTGSLVCKFSDIFQESEYSPDFVVVHGDVVTAFAAATAAFFNKIPIGHVEAGLRTARFETPHPEEGIRRMISRIATLHFAPTEGARQNLLQEGNENESIFVTGNTVVDSILDVINYRHAAYAQHILEDVSPSKKIILITCHRRESWGEPLRNLCRTIRSYAASNSDTVFVWPVHGNPQVSTIVHQELEGTEGIILTGHLPYLDFVSILKLSHLLVTDSGGVLEEASYLNIPTLILRNEIERPEALTLDNVKLIGYNFGLLYSNLSDCHIRKKYERNLVFGDGTAGEQIGNAIVRYLKEGKKNE